MALYLDPVAGSHIGQVIVDRAVITAAIVPERDGVRLPAEAKTEFGRAAMLLQKLRDALAFALGHAVKPAHRRAAHIERYPTKWKQFGRIAL